jgi:hypothetical protein
MLDILPTELVVEIVKELDYYSLVSLKEASTRYNDIIHKSLMIKKLKEDENLREDLINKIHLERNKGYQSYIFRECNSLKFSDLLNKKHMVKIDFFMYIVFFVICFFLLLFVLFAFPIAITLIEIKNLIKYYFGKRDVCYCGDCKNRIKRMRKRLERICGEMYKKRVEIRR